MMTIECCLCRQLTGFWNSFGSVHTMAIECCLCRQLTGFWNSFGSVHTMAIECCLCRQHMRFWNSFGSVHTMPIECCLCRQLTGFWNSFGSVHTMAIECCLCRQHTRFWNRACDEIPWEAGDNSNQSCAGRMGGGGRYRAQCHRQLNTIYTQRASSDLREERLSLCSEQEVGAESSRPAALSSC